MSLARARALALVGVLIVLALILVGVTVAHDRQHGSTFAGLDCPDGAVPVVTRPLPNPTKIRINVRNGTGRAGLAGQVAEQFRSRGFTVVAVTDADHQGGVARLIYGPDQLAAASVVNSYFLGEATDAFDVHRTDAVVDVTIGTDFRQLGTKTEVSQAQAAMGNPSPPPGTCEAR
jgi:hypothetical protein